ncbi:nodulation protein NfeD, partial [Candidatus Poribacteria bacterium]
KIVAHTVGEVKKIAAERGRNTKWAEESVRESISSTSEEALQPLLLSLDNLDFQGDLDDSSVSEGLRQELKGDEEKRGILLSDDAAVVIEEKGRKWLINDGKQTYIVSKEKGKLNFYQKVIDLLAEDLDELLEKIDGWKVVTESGEHILNTRDADVNQVEMSFTERLLSIIADPNIAYMLMILGFYGIFFELSKPGSIFPGVVGGICLILAFFAFQVLPVNYAGVLLILFAIGLFVLEIKVTSYGLLSVGGIVAMLVGSMMLINTEEPFAYILEISWKVIFSTTLVTAGLFIIAVILIIKTHMKRPITGREGLIGVTGTCQVEINPEGKIFVHGELWNSISDEVIHPKEKVKVVGADGLTLRVEKLKQEDM